MMLIFDTVGILLALVGIRERIGIGETLKEFTLSLRDFVVGISCADDRPAAAGGCEVAFLDQQVILLRR